MKMAIEDGGPAFPFTPNQQMQLPNGTWDQNTDFGDPGMSLRDYFAAKAMQSIVSNWYRTYLEEDNHTTEQLDSMIADAECRDDMSMQAYAIADAMLNARQVPPTE